jgi:broad specificity phosphatase PhoE
MFGERLSEFFGGSKMEKEPINEEKEKEYGHNIHMEVDFDRHFSPDKDPVTGSSLDFLAPKGHREKIKAGKQLSSENLRVKEYASEKHRAQQSAMEINSLDDEQKAAQIINQKLTSALKEKLSEAGYDNKKLDRRSFKFLARIKKELNPLNFGAEYKKKCFIKNPDAPKDKWQKRNYNEVVQYWLDNPDKSGETTTADETAAALAYRLDTCMRMADRLYNESNILLKHKTHGPNPDALLKEIMINEDGSVGFEKVEDIGGALAPGESLKFVIDIDENGNRTTKLKFRDKLYDYDEGRFKELVDLYAEKTGGKKRYETTS